MRELLRLAALVFVVLMLASPAAATPTPSDQDEMARQAMKALGRTQDAWSLLGDLDHARYCQKMYGYAEAGFDYPTQAFYCRAADRWIKINPDAACVSLFGSPAYADSNKEHCSRPGPAGTPVLKAAGNPPVIAIPRGTVDKPFDTSVPRPPLMAVAEGGLTAAANATPAEVARPGVADQPAAGATSGPVGAFNQLPVFLRVLFAGGGAMIVGLWAGGFAIRMMP